MSDAITWHNGVDRFDANPTATVALDRARWEILGATFVEVDDGDDETPGLAVGEVDGLEFGVLDYGEGETFLLVGGELVAGPATARLFEALQRAEVLQSSEVVHTSSAEGHPQLVELQQRVEALDAILVEVEGLRREAREAFGQLSFRTRSQGDPFPNAEHHAVPSSQGGWTRRTSGSTERS